MQEDRTCYYYCEDTCYNAANTTRKCCDPTITCALYRKPIAYITLKSIYLRGAYNGERLQDQHRQH